MSALVLHHGPGCALSRSVRIALAEKGLAHDLRTVDLARHEQLSPGFLALNPRGQVPVLEAEGAVLTEAFFILCYLDERYPDPPLGGADPAARYRVHQVGQLVERAVAPNLALLEWAGRRGPVPGSDALGRLPPERQTLWRKAAEGFSGDEVTAARAGLTRALGDCEAWLATHDWLAGADYTIADMLLFPLVERVAAIGPALREWRARVAQRVGVASTAEEPVVTMGPERGRWG